jgi:hypothetical protein
MVGQQPREAPLSTADRNLLLEARTHTWSAHCIPRNLRRRTDEPLCAPRCPEPQTASSADHAGVGLNKPLDPGLLGEQQERLATTRTQPRVGKFLPVCQISDGRSNGGQQLFLQHFGIKPIFRVRRELQTQDNRTCKQIGESFAIGAAHGADHRVCARDPVPQSSSCENKRSSLAISLKRLRPLSPLVRPLPEAGL